MTTLNDTAKNTAKEIRQLLKAHGYTARQISVRSYLFDTDIDIAVTIKDLSICAKEIKQLTAQFIHINEDERTHEWLGGNRFVSVEYDPKVVDEMAKKFDGVVAQMAEIGKTMTHPTKYFGLYLHWVKDQLYWDKIPVDERLTRILAIREMQNKLI